MATLTLQGLWISLASDDSQVMWLPYGSGLQLAGAKSVTAAQYADGGIRMVTGNDFAEKWTGAAQALTAAQWRLLRFPKTRGGWLGELVSVRDYLGTRFWGFLDPPTIGVHDYDTEADVSLSFSQVTFYEWPQP